MREIMFRGQLSHTREWVYGNLIISRYGNPYIYPQDLIEQDGHHLIFDTDEAFWVIPETVNQWTGISDKNNKGTKIFDADILEDECGERWLVYWEEEALSWFVKSGNTEIPLADLEGCTNIKVIGNTTDNPEILKEVQS